MVCWVEGKINTFCDYFYPYNNMCITMVVMINIDEMQGANQSWFKAYFFQYLIDTLSLISINNINNNVSIGDLVKNVDKLQKNECVKECKIQLFGLPLISLVRIQFIKILKSIASLLGYGHYDFVNYDLVWYNCMSEIFANIIR